MTTTSTLDISTASTNCASSILQPSGNAHINAWSTSTSWYEYEVLFYRQIYQNFIVVCNYLQTSTDNQELILLCVTKIIESELQAMIENIVNILIPSMFFERVLPALSKNMLGINM